MTSPRDIFFRVSDRLQLEACLHAVEQDRKSVVMHSMAPGLIDHYGDMLVQKLKQRLPESTVEVFFPTNTEALITRFNDVLEHLSVDAALQAQAPLPPQRIWVVHDAHALPAHELQLLTRLLQHFPGAQVAAVLMLGGGPNPIKTIDPQGRRLMHWSIEPPTQEQIDQTLNEAREHGREFAALEIVAQLDLRPAAPKTLGPLVDDFAPATPHKAPPKTASKAPSQDAPQEERAQRPIRWLPWTLGIAFMLALSAGVTVWLQPAAVNKLFSTQASAAALPQSPAASTPSAPEPTSTPTPESTPAATSAAADAAATSAAATPASTSIVTTATAPVLVAAAPTASAVAPSPTPSSAAPTSAAPTSTAGSPPTKPTAAAAPAPALVTELPDSAIKGRTWLKGLPADTFVLQHGLYPTAQQASKLAGSGYLTNARVVPVYTKAADNAQFTLVTGPFRSEDRARTTMSRMDMPSSVKIVPTSTMLERSRPAQSVPKN